MIRRPLPRNLTLALIGLVFPLFLNSCGSSPFFGKDTRNKMIVSVTDQKMLLVRDGKPVKTYNISTSKFGVGDIPNSNRTPLGRLQVAKKIGCQAPPGAVFKSRRPTGEVLKPNAPGRDPIVSRILWLTGTEHRNRNTFRRTIYIHGTPEEKRLGAPASYGCIRMGTRDVIDLYDRIGPGADVFVIRGPIQTRSSSNSAVASSKPGNKFRS